MRRPLFHSYEWSTLHVLCMQHVHYMYTTCNTYITCAPHAHYMHTTYRPQFHSYEWSTLHVLCMQHVHYMYTTCNTYITCAPHAHYMHTTYRPQLHSYEWSTLHVHTTCNTYITRTLHVHYMHTAYRPQFHSYERRVLTLVRGEIGSRVSVNGSIVMGSTVSNGVQLTPNAVVMKHEQLMPYTVYEGAPCTRVAMRRQLAGGSDGSGGSGGGGVLGRCGRRRKEVELAAAAHPAEYAAASLAPPDLEQPPPPNAKLPARLSGKEPLCMAIYRIGSHYPDKVAIRAISGSILATYGTLLHCIQRVAADLLDHGFAEDELAGVMIPRSPAAVVALLGVAFAGGAYVPLDPNYPQARLTQFILAAQLQKILVEGPPDPSGWLAAAHPTVAEIRVEMTMSSSQRSTPPPPSSSAKKGGRLLYVLFTSGTTGQVVPQQLLIRRPLIGCVVLMPLYG